MNE
ncbi:hypothetical protein D046_0088, partial [Vibrio parahaemolyticus V-223/04]|jgi:hypothetical protein